MTGGALTPESVRLEAATAGDEARLTGALRSLAPEITDEGKELVIRAAVTVAMADGSVGPREQELLVEIARSLEMSRERFQAVLEEVVRPDASPGDDPAPSAERPVR